MSENETHKTFLNEEELLLIAEQQITIKRLEQVRDIFLFRCYTGLSYCDVAKLPPPAWRKSSRAGSRLGDLCYDAQPSPKESFGEDLNQTGEGIKKNLGN
jgi:hypothetical protein